MFEDFYAAYPRKIARGAAEKAYKEQLRKGVSDDELLAGCRLFAALVRERGTDRTFIPHPATWLRAGRWEDDELRSIPGVSSCEGTHIDCPSQYRFLAAYLTGCAFHDKTLTVPNKARKSLILSKFSQQVQDLTIEVAP